MIPVSDFQSLFEAAPGLYLILLPDLTIVGASDAYLEATMTKRTMITGKKLFDVFPDNPHDYNADGVSNLTASLNTVIRTKQLHRMPIQKYDIRKPDGQFEVRYWSPINKPFLENQTVKYIIHRVEDITEFVRIQKESTEKDKLTENLQQKTSEMEMEIFLRSEEIRKINTELEQRARQLEETNRQLETVNKELNSFTYSVSHDLRAPLRAIDGYSKMLEEDYGPKLDKEGLRLLDRIQQNARKMGTLIDDLLVFSKLGRKEIQKSEVNMKLLLEEVINEVKPSESTVEIQIGEILSVPADYSLIRQVMINLISNAIKYSSLKDRPTVLIQSEKREGENIYSIKDNGVGFEMEYAHKLFGVFQRLHSNEEFEGTGVGLAVVQRIIHKHGGNVWAESEPGKGATFYFSLPLN